MKELLWLIPNLPFFGALILILFNSRLPKNVSAVIGSGTVGTAALITMLVGYDFLNSGLPSYRHVAWNWFEVGPLSTAFAFHLDAQQRVVVRPAPGRVAADEAVGLDAKHGVAFKHSKDF